MNRQIEQRAQKQGHIYVRIHTMTEVLIQINEKELRIINGSWEIDDLNVKNNKLLPHFIYKIQVQVD